MCGSIRFTRCTAVTCARFALQEGHTPCPLYEKATRSSSLQLSQRTRWAVLRKRRSTELERTRQKFHRVRFPPLPTVVQEPTAPLRTRSLTPDLQVFEERGTRQSQQPGRTAFVVVAAALLGGLLEGEHSAVQQRAPAQRQGAQHLVVQLAHACPSRARSQPGAHCETFRSDSQGACCPVSGFPDCARGKRLAQTRVDSVGWSHARPTRNAAVSALPAGWMWAEPSCEERGQGHSTCP